MLLFLVTSAIGIIYFNYISETDAVMFRANADRTGVYNEDDGPKQFNQVLWKADLVVGFSSPAVSDSTLYVGSPNNNVYVINSQTGEELWRFQTDYTTDSSPILSEAVVYLGAWNRNPSNLKGSLYAIK